MQTKTYISYYRVSTAKQGQSGLGLEAQEKTVKDYVQRQGGEIIKSFTECESGKKDSRAELLKAISESKAKSATLVIAKLDRLSRSVKFIFTLRDSGVDFVCADIPEANTLTIGIFAVMAQYERELISKRTKDALQAKKARGWKAGNPKIGLYSAVAHAARDRTPDLNSNNVKAVGMILSLRGAGKTYPEIAKALNESNMQTTYNKAFTAKTVEVLYLREKRKLQAA